MHHQFIIILCILLLFFSCANEAKKQSETTVAKEALYTPQTAEFNLKGSVANTSAITISLYNDAQSQELAKTTTTGGSFQLSAPNLAKNEVYFLHLQGKTYIPGLDSIDWIEKVPVFFADNTELSLVGSPYDGMESLSKMRFHIEANGAEQQFLNEWQSVVDAKTAEIENQITSTYALGGGAAKQSGKRENMETALNDISESFIALQKPLVSTLFLVSQRTDHRSKRGQYKEIYAQADDAVQQSKYGVDLFNRITRINNSIAKIDMDQMLVATDSKMLPFKIDNYEQKEYLVFSYWASWEAASIANLELVKSIVDSVNNEKIGLIHLSLDDRYSVWKDLNDENKLEGSYMLRGEAKQKMIDSLYLSELPRYMVVKPDGTIVNSDVELGSLHAELSLL